MLRLLIPAVHRVPLPIALVAAAMAAAAIVHLHFGHHILGEDKITIEGASSTPTTSPLNQRMPREIPPCKIV